LIFPVQGVKLKEEEESVSTRAKNLKKRIKFKKKRTEIFEFSMTQNKIAPVEDSP
jgi:hypothetical protein